MRIYKLLLFVVTLCFTFAGCMSVDDIVERIRLSFKEGSFDAPANQESSPRNPFNDVRPNYVSDNCLGFYSGDVCYRQPFKMAPFSMNDTFQRTKYQYLSPFQCKKDCDTVVIASLVTRLDYYFYGPPDNGERYFSKIAFWFRKGEIRSGTHVYLDGSRASLCDNYRVAYEILSASIVFDEAFSIGYNSGAFTVTYKTLKGGTAQLTGGRFKLLPPNENGDESGLNDNLFRDFFFVDDY